MVNFLKFRSQWCKEFKVEVQQHQVFITLSGSYLAGSKWTCQELGHLAVKDCNNLAMKFYSIYMWLGKRKCQDISFQCFFIKMLCCFPPLYSFPGDSEPTPPALSPLNIWKLRCSKTLEPSLAKSEIVQRTEGTSRASRHVSFWVLLEQITFHQHQFHVHIQSTCCLTTSLLPKLLSIDQHGCQAAKGLAHTRGWSKTWHLSKALLSSASWLLSKAMLPLSSLRSSFFIYEEFCCSMRQLGRKALQGRIDLPCSDV